jgi:hypothetical protein
LPDAQFWLLRQRAGVAGLEHAARFDFAHRLLHLAHARLEPLATPAAVAVYVAIA